MLGKRFLYSVILIIVLLLPSVATAQVCKFNKADPAMFIDVDGETYAYQTIEKNKAMLVAAKERDLLREEISMLKEKVEILKRNTLIKDQTILLYADAMAAEREIFDRALGTKDLKTPFLRQPVVNQAFGVIITGTLFFLWKFAENSQVGFGG